jgi:hypothetical protein
MIPISFLLSTLLLLVPADVPIEARHLDAVEIYHIDFGPAADANFDGWPDNWTRLRSPEHPAFVPAAISREPAAVGERCLRIDLDGGAAVLYSPPIPVSALYSYVLEGYLKTERLRKNVAYVSLTFADAEGKPLEVHESPHAQDARLWEKIRIGPVSPSHPDVRRALIGFHLRPAEGGSGDLVGAALVDDLWLARLPRMTLRSNSEHNVYTDPRAVTVSCELSGISERDPIITFELVDVSRRQVAKVQHRLEGEIIAQESSRASALLSQGTAAPAGGYAGATTWKPPIPDYGFYEIRVSMRSSTGLMHERTLPLAVMRPQAPLRDGEFGWSLPKGENPLPLNSLPGLLGQVGINWVKFPVWYSEKDVKRADELAWLTERLGSDGIELVGMIDQPPADVRHLFGEQEYVPAAAIFAEPQLWHPVLDPIMTRLSLKVRWWQLGRDDDTSFVGFAEARQRVGEVKRQLKHFGQENNLGLGWRWLNEPPNDPSPPWEFLSYTVDPPLTPAEFEVYLASVKNHRARRWVVIEPLARTEYDVPTRARDLVARMLAAKIGGAECAFVPDPFHAERGLMNDDGTPGELLLPWRTTALMISGAKYVGSIVMPNGSQNHIFFRGGEAVMVVWNERPVEEVLYLGEDTRQVDLWGRAVTPAPREHEQVIEAGPLPTFVTGLNQHVALLRMSFSFGRGQLESVFGRPQSESFRFKNLFQQGVGGHVTLDLPKVWDIDRKPPTFPFKLAAGEEFSEAFRVTLKADARSGSQNVRADFEFTADRSYKFSVYRNIEIGLDDVILEIATHINERGELVVEQHLENKSDRFVNFNCFLFAPGRRRLRQQVFNLGRGRDTRTFVLPAGEELLGQTLWLRAEELGGERILNYSITAEP